jgi:hypothetical protein
MHSLFMSIFFFLITFDTFDSPSLPCFEFSEGDGRTTVGQQMMDTFCKPKYKEIAACISAYGQIRSGGSLSLARGVARLSRHFEDINAKFRGNSYCFEVVIDKVVYQGASKFSPTKGKNMAVIDILTELQHEIPRRYLHIPDENFKFCVGKKELAFKYWSERMVEFTKIEIPVRSDTPWREDFGEDTDDSYVLRVFLGFDRYRIRDPERGLSSNKACSLYIYSRVSTSTCLCSSVFRCFAHLFFCFSIQVDWSNTTRMRAPCSGYLLGGRTFVKH